LSEAGAPFFLIEEFGRGDFSHVGSIDIDIAVNPELVRDDEYSTIVDLIEERGYSLRRGVDGQPIVFSFEREISSRVDGRSYRISIDFLTSTTVNSGNHRHRRVQPSLPARIANGCDIEFQHNFKKEVRGTLPDGGEARAQIQMLDIAGCIGMKGVVLGERYKEKDAYDIFSVMSQCLDGPAAVARKVRPFLAEQSMGLGMTNIKDKFRSVEAEGLHGWGLSWPTLMLSRKRGTRRRATLRPSGSCESWTPAVPVNEAAHVLISALPPFRRP